MAARKIHCIGIGGIGVSALAKWYRLQGCSVNGSDVKKSEISADCEAMGIEVFEGHNPNNIRPDTDMVIYSDAVQENNPERNEARRLHITEMSYAQALGEISRNKRTIAISGTNGKSTTTAMVGLILEAAGFDPTVIVGSKVSSFKHGNLRVGKTDWFVVEGDEYRDHMLHLAPEMIILTNIELDHTDYFRDVKHLEESFMRYVDGLHKQREGTLVVNLDNRICERISAVARGYARVITFGSAMPADFLGRHRRSKSQRQYFDLTRKVSQEETMGTIELQIPGEINMYNALAAASCAVSLGISLATIQKALADFSGIWRRFERVGTWKGAEIISDYAHHPTSVAATLAAAREFFPGKRIIAVFQPHHRNRTRALFDDFAKSFSGADVAIVNEIYDVAGREEDGDTISSRELVEAMKHPHAHYAADLDETLRLSEEIIKERDVVLIMGAGSIDSLARKLVQKSLPLFL
ncbi:MAG: UDP-N-acetylmuramate--L-alanine ligase [Patescibacteria group bacterium]